MNVAGLLCQNDRYISPYTTLESLTADRPPLFNHHQHPPSQSVCFRSTIDHCRYGQPPSPSSHPPSASSAAFCYRQFVGRPPFRGVLQRQPTAAPTSSNPPLSPSSSASSTVPVDYSPKASSVGVESLGKTAGGGGVSSTTGGQRRSSAFQEGVTVGYTYDAFFVSDGRSRRRDSHHHQQPQQQPQQQQQQQAPSTTHQHSSPPAAHRQGQSRQRYTCAECGKHYATSSNLSRHKQTHRSLDSQQARHCPHCGKV